MTARDGKRRDAGFTRRLLLATTLQGAALAALGFRLYSLQVPRQDDFLTDSLNTRTVTRFVCVILRSFRLQAGASF